MDPNDLAKYVFEGKLDISYSEQILGVTPELAEAMVRVERARSVWPVAILSMLLLAVTFLIVKFCDASVAWPVAFMIAPIGTATVWRVLARGHGTSRSN